MQGWADDAWSKQSHADPRRQRVGGVSAGGLKLWLRCREPIDGNQRQLPAREAGGCHGDFAFASERFVPAASLHRNLVVQQQPETPQRRVFSAGERSLTAAGVSSQRQGDSAAAACRLIDAEDDFDSASPFLSITGQGSSVAFGLQDFFK